jgi:alpha-amylase/alpha-mannosidase (GH57 family)
MTRLNVAFFWHMHQPYYRDPLSGEYSLPWVRLHGLKGYYDMISLLEDFPTIRQTFNLVPSLLRQLQDYACGEARDLFLDLTRKPAAELSSEEKKFILRNFFMCHWETMVKPYPGYWALLQKRGFKPTDSRLGDLLPHFSIQDFRDLQVWFNLTWTGYRAREKKESLRELLKKGRSFSEADKEELLQSQSEILKEIIPLYHSAQSRGQIEVTTSPFYHPILPILIDSAHASRAMPQASLPFPFSYPEDAEAQVQKALALYRDLFGKNPSGMWPPEGSVSPELIPIIHRAGLRWLASDEGILFKSLPPEAGRASLYQPYLVNHQGEEAAMVFRDRNLSDLIGFTYAKNPPQASANDLLTHFKNIQDSLSGTDTDALVLIALDGENPWEYYPDGGQGFLRVLYERLSREAAFPTVKIGEFLETAPPRETLDRLHTGSWIEQNFRIWIGSPEDNQAWECLRRTRTFLKRASENMPALSPQMRQQAWEEVYVAEGSDWFWWYGDDFHSDNDEEFDRLFRLHLSHVHLLLGAEVPDYLKNSIVLHHEVKPTMEPVGLLSPVIDGRVTHFYEWRAAGYFAAKLPGESMYRSEGFVSGIYYGFDLERLYLRIDPILGNRNHLEGLQFAVHFLTALEWQIAFPVTFSERAAQVFTLCSRAPGPARVPRDFTSIRSDRIVELSIPFAELRLHPKEKVNFYVRVEKGDLEVERYPRSGFLAIAIPDRDFENSFWQV